ncbi:MAG TPA: DUF4159 domain-containing protein, partial [Tepidisphaeraceae bacterium]|nr:DUF4159 domain-containing protein [Tepidisphaeraceae bacterium]
APVPDPIPVARFPDFPWDNSNSQYGLLGVWCGAEVGVEVPSRYWRDVEGHWLRSELQTGEWGYRAFNAQGTMAMNCAGVASLLVTHEYIQAPGLHGAVGREIYGPGLAAGLRWLETGDNCMKVTGPGTHYMGYNLYGIERVGLASGFKYFGSHDWYRELAKRALARQWPNGAWGRSQTGEDTVIDTAYVLLFLSSGRHPVFMNKLRFDGSWSNRPRDLANLTRFAAHNTERALNWQVVSFDHDWQDWMNCPVLYLASHKPPQLNEQQYAMLRQFVNAGGLLFTHADAGSPEFTRWVNDTLVPRICPGHALEPLHDDDPIFHVNYNITPGAVKLMGVSNGSRLLLVHSPADLAMAWQGNFEKVKPDAFRIGMNIFLYAAGKTDLRNRLVSPILPEPPKSEVPAIQVARLRYAGNWDPEPAAWDRFARACRWDTSAAIAPSPVDLSALRPNSSPIAHLTGTALQSFTPVQTQAVRKYVEAGGILLIDPCGGSDDFAMSVGQSLLKPAFPGLSLSDIPAGHPLLKGLGHSPDNFGPVRLRPYAAARLNLVPPGLQMLTAGKGAVIVSPLDLTTGLLGSNTWPIMGYAPASCEKFVENLVIWTVTRSASHPHN